MSYYDINKINTDNLFSSNLTNQNEETFSELLASKIESQKWCLGIDTTLTYHTDINGILQRSEIGSFREIETDDSTERNSQPTIQSGNFILLPQTGYGWISNAGSPDSQHWGEPRVIQALIQIAKTWKDLGNTLPLVYGDISMRNGESFPPHKTHKKGLDVDIRPIGSVPGGVTIYSNYRRDKTRELISIIRKNGIALVDVIGFQDPIFVSEGLTRNWKGHLDHLHVRFK